MTRLLTFHRNFVWPLTFISLFGCFIILASGSWLFAITMFWTKVITNTLTGFYFHLFHQEQFYFFHNLGYTKTQLYAFCFLFDMAVWAALTALTISLL
jgi:hypothetical protein